MGKRSTNTTKGGKFMNPTDQARKEARRKELKKNKKQRQVVRVATLKGKNPREIIEELEKIDDMEYNPITPCALNAKVYFSHFLFTSNENTPGNGRKATKTRGDMGPGDQNLRKGKP